MSADESLFADNCAPGIRGLQLDGDTVIDTRTWDLPIEQVYSLGQGDDGELYVLSQDRGLFRIEAR